MCVPAPPSELGTYQTPLPPGDNMGWPSFFIPTPLPPSSSGQSSSSSTSPPAVLSPSRPTIYSPADHVTFSMEMELPDTRSGSSRRNVVVVPHRTDAMAPAPITHSSPQLTRPEYDQHPPTRQAPNSTDHRHNHQIRRSHDQRRDAYAWTHHTHHLHNSAMRRGEGGAEVGYMSSRRYGSVLGPHAHSSSSSSRPYHHHRSRWTVSSLSHFEPSPVRVYYHPPAQDAAVPLPSPPTPPRHRLSQGVSTVGPISSSSSSPSVPPSFLPLSSSSSSSEAIATGSAPTAPSTSLVAAASSSPTSLMTSTVTTATGPSVEHVSSIEHRPGDHTPTSLHLLHQQRLHQHLLQQRHQLQRQLSRPIVQPAPDHDTQLVDGPFYAQEAVVRMMNVAQQQQRQFQEQQQQQHHHRLEQQAQRQQLHHVRDMPSNQHEQGQEWWGWHSMPRDGCNGDEWEEEKEEHSTTGNSPSTQAFIQILEQLDKDGQGLEDQDHELLCGMKPTRPFQYTGVRAGPCSLSGAIASLSTWQRAATVAASTTGSGGSLQPRTTMEGYALRALAAMYYQDGAVEGREGQEGQERSSSSSRLRRRGRRARSDDDGGPGQSSRVEQEAARSVPVGLGLSSGSSRASTSSAVEGPRGTSQGSQPPLASSTSVLESEGEEGWTEFLR